MSSVTLAAPQSGYTISDAASHKVDDNVDRAPTGTSVSLYASLQSGETFSAG